MILETLVLFRPGDLLQGLAPDQGGLDDPFPFPVDHPPPRQKVEQVSRVGDAQKVHERSDTDLVSRCLAFPRIRIDAEKIENIRMQPFPIEALFVQQVSDVIPQLTDDPSSHLIGKDLRFTEHSQEQCADLLEEVFIAEKGASFPCMFVDAENRRSEDSEEDNAKFLALITLLMATNQPPENPVLQAIAALQVGRGGLEKERTSFQSWNNRIKSVCKGISRKQ